MRDDHRHRVRVPGPHVDKMNVESVDFGDELRLGVQFCFDLPPVVVSSPLAREALHRHELHALSGVGDSFARGPLRRLDAPSQVGELRVRRVNA